MNLRKAFAERGGCSRDELPKALLCLAIAVQRSQRMSLSERSAPSPKDHALQCLKKLDLMWSLIWTEHLAWKMMQLEVASSFCAAGVCLFLERFRLRR